VAFCGYKARENKERKGEIGKKKKDPKTRGKKEQNWEGEKPVTRNRRKAGKTGEQTGEIPRNREASRRGDWRSTNRKP